MPDATGEVHNCGFSYYGFFAPLTILPLFAPIRGRAETPDELYKDITTILIITRILVIIRKNIPLTLMEKHDEKYSAESRIDRFAGKSLLRRHDHFIRLFLVPFRRQSGVQCR
jgi:hypothetical protein